MKNIFNKIHKHGILGSLKIVRALFFDQYCSFIVKIPRSSKLRFCCNLLKLIFLPAPKKKRILGIWDYKALPWSVGDPLVFVEALSVFKCKHKVEIIDICIIYDRDNPSGNRGVSFEGHMNKENAQDYLLDFLPLFSTCPFLGSIYQFNSREEFYRFLKHNFNRYKIFPPLKKHLAETYNYALGGQDYIFIQEFFKENGFIPNLRVGERDGAWAKWLYLNILPKDSIPIALSLKRTSHRIENNADPATWLSFIDMCKLGFPEVIFVVVGLRGEVFADLRERSNVIIAKDFGTSVIEDLALIRSSLIYMGTNSGVNTIAIFSDLPYLIFQWSAHTLYTCFKLKLGEKFAFATDEQKIFSSEIIVTPEFLFKEFKALYSRLDKNEWSNITLDKARKKHSHPSTKVIG